MTSSDEEIRKRKFDYFLPRMVTSQVALLVIGLIEGLLVWNIVPRSRYLGWLALLLLVTGYRLSLIFRYRHQTADHGQPTVFWHRRLLAATFASGVVMSLTFWLTWPRIHPFVAFADLLILFGLVTGAAVADFWMKWGFRLFIIPLLASFELIFALRVIPHFWIDSILVFLFAVAIDRMARFNDKGFDQSLLSSLQTEKIKETLDEINRQLETELRIHRENERELAILFDSVPLFLAYVTPDQKLRRINRALADHLGGPAVQTLPLDPAQLFGDEEYERLKPYFQKAAHGEVIQALPTSLRDDEFGGRHFLVQCIPIGPELPTEFILVLSDVTSLKITELRLREQTHKDPLTGLGNRRSFNPLLNQVCQFSNTQQPTVLLYLDLDAFKSINDTLGHAVGDRVLENLATLLMRSVRKTDHVFRIGGDEFAILLNKIGTEGANQIVRRILKESAETLTPQAMSRPVTLSIGGILIDRSGVKAEQWLEAADQALYRAKRLGGNRVAWSTGPQT